jgi:hypothetical protein
MREAILPVMLLLIAACSGAKPSRWEPRLPLEGPEIVCSCDGKVREPKPDEASTADDPRVVLAMCEGRVYDCRESRGACYGGRCLD